MSGYTKQQRAYILVGFWALFVSIINTARKYIQYKDAGMEDYTHFSVLFRHFIAHFTIFAAIGFLVVFLYHKFKQN